MTALSDLIARLEAAKEGSRELDRKIAFAVNWNGFQNEDQIYKENADDIPNWTQSLDAALTLVSRGYSVHASMFDEHPVLGNSFDVGAAHKGLHATSPALALCIAALKAREAAR